MKSPSGRGAFLLLFRQLLYADTLRLTLYYSNMTHIKTNTCYIC